MKTSPTRRLTIVDTMIFVASTAIGFAVLRVFAASGWFFRQDFVLNRISFMAQCVNEACFPFLATWTSCFFYRVGIRRIGLPASLVPRAPGRNSALSLLDAPRPAAPIS